MQRYAPQQGFQANTLAPVRTQTRRRLQWDCLCCTSTSTQKSAGILSVSLRIYFESALGMDDNKIKDWLLPTRLMSFRSGITSGVNDSGSTPWMCYNWSNLLPFNHKSMAHYSILTSVDLVARKWAILFFPPTCLHLWTTITQNGSSATTKLAAYLTQNAPVKELLPASIPFSTTYKGGKEKRKKRLRFSAQVVTATILPIGLDSAEISVRKNPTLADLNSRAPVFPALLNSRSSKRGQERLVCLQGRLSVGAVYVPPLIFEIWLRGGWFHFHFNITWEIVSNMNKRKNNSSVSNYQSLKGGLMVLVFS